MSYLTTELLTSLLQGGAAANEFLRSKIEEGVNAVLKAELAGFLGYEKHSSAVCGIQATAATVHISAPS